MDTESQHKRTDFTPSLSLAFLQLMGWIGCFDGYPDARLCQAFNRSGNHGYQVIAIIIVGNRY